jgi:SpoVK/Ycf46/Vps4 family AAA+-type ATPase
MLHVGPPAVQAPRKIFEIYLRDEILDEVVDASALATQTQCYSGSDIRTVCVNAAFLCDALVKRNEQLIQYPKQNHLVAALNRCAPIVPFCFKRNRIICR